MKHTIMILVAALFVGTTGLGSVAAQTNQPPIQINATEIGSRIQVIGKLGKPLGTTMKVRARGIAAPAVQLDKDAYWTHMVYVEAVDGKQLPKPVMLEWTVWFIGERLVIPKPTETIELLAFESGGFTGSPSNLPGDLTRADVGYGFKLRLVAVRKL
jgi:hypothetical protein